MTPGTRRGLLASALRTPIVGPQVRNLAPTEYRLNHFIMSTSMNVGAESGSCRDRPGPNPCRHQRCAPRFDAGRRVPLLLLYRLGGRRFRFSPCSGLSLYAAGPFKLSSKDLLGGSRWDESDWGPHPGYRNEIVSSRVTSTDSCRMRAWIQRNSRHCWAGPKFSFTSISRAFTCLSSTTCPNSLKLLTSSPVAT